MNIKNYNSITESGRSMIEMLGVLAIIGILSVGGIAGYSKAMDRYRTNETISQIIHIAQNIRDLFKNQPDVYGSMSFSDSSMSTATNANRILADKAKLFPDTLVKNNYKNLFGGNIRLFADGRFSKDDGKAFVLGFTGIPQEACMELATRDWQGSLGLVAMKVHHGGASDTGYSIQGYYIGNCSSKYKESAGVFCAADLPITLEQAATTCTNTKDNAIWWKFY